MLTVIGFFLRVAKAMKAQALPGHKKLGAKWASKWSFIVVNLLMLLEGLGIASSVIAAGLRTRCKVGVDFVLSHVGVEKGLVPTDVGTSRGSTRKRCYL